MAFKRSTVRSRLAPPIYLVKTSAYMQPRKGLLSFMTYP